MHINPDHFLETLGGRITTPERNQRAWEQCYQALEVALHRASPATRVFLMIGPQGAGKSTWAKAFARKHPEAVIFDAILVKRIEREPILAAAARHGVMCVAVWFTTPLDVCLARNTARPPDEVCDEQGVRNVFAAVERPTLEEGFEQVIEVSDRHGA